MRDRVDRSGADVTRFLSIGIMVIVLLAGCGNEPAEPTPSPLAAPTESPLDAASSPPADPFRQPPTAAGTPVTNDGDVASGCWSEDQSTSGGQQSLQWSAPPQMVIDPARLYTAVLETSKGQITLQLLPEAAPVTVNNFVCLTRAGYYTNAPFHRIVEGFVIQGGDPTGTGSGGPGYQFEDEPVLGEYLPGYVAMANAGANTNGSQFFIITADLRDRLPKQYNLFARVIDGQDTVDAIAAVETAPNQQGEVSVPVEPVTLNSVTVYEH